MLEEENRLTAKRNNSRPIFVHPRASDHEMTMGTRFIFVLVIPALQTIGIIHVSTGHFNTFILRQDAC